MGISLIEQWNIDWKMPTARLSDCNIYEKWGFLKQNEQMLAITGDTNCPTTLKIKHNR